MTREQAREAAAVMLAFADGKEVQVRVRGGTAPWTHHSNLLDGTWDWDAFEFQIKPTATPRPWTSDEVPLGAWMRNKKSNEGRFLVTHTGSQFDRIQWHKDYEHSTDGGKTWLPCGVVEESK